MFSKTLLLVITLFTGYTYAQIPAGYYDAAAGLTCQPLKTALKQITVTGSNVLSYSPGLWNLYQYSDMRRNDANTMDIIWDMYTDLPSGSTYSDGTPEIEFEFGIDQDPGLGGTFEGEYYNREHTFPQSWFADALPMRSDAHHIYPTDKKVNNARGNSPFGLVNKSATGAPLFYKSKNLSYHGNAIAGLGFTGSVFEPIDEYKGDIARAQLYMAVRYEDEILNWYSNSNADEVLLSPSDEPDAAMRLLQVFDDWYLNLLVSWHIQDPVSQKEIDRNNAIYYQAVEISPGVFSAQANRNPFIDHPEYVTEIWQCTGLLPVTITEFNGMNESDGVSLKWKVENEVNFLKYVVQRSTSGSHFSSIAEVNASGASFYRYKDRFNYSGNVFYRLKLVDVDGSSRYSEIISVQRTTEVSGLKIFPVPATSFINIESTSPLQNAEFILTDMKGSTVLKKNFNSGNIAALQVSHLSPGIYVLHSVIHGKRDSRTVIIAH